MATMAGPRLIDPTKSGKYPLSISEALLREDGPRKRQRLSVQYNHRPQSLAGQDAIIKPSKDGEENSYSLLIKSEDANGDYKYKGVQRPSASLALIYSPEKKSFVLEKIDAEFRFNLRSTPASKDSISSPSQYPQLETGEPGTVLNGTNGAIEDEDDPDDLPADPSKPYDYRHFLKRGGSPSPAPSVISSPMPNHNFGSSPLLSAASPIKRPRSRTEPKKPSRHRNERYLSPHPREEIVDADKEESDSNELVIDMGDSEPKNTRPWRAALGVLNEGKNNSRPISLRSAASSMSPSIRGDSEDEKSDHDIEEIDLGESGIDIVSHGAAGEDVITNGIGLDDEDDGLAAELEQAMEEQAMDDLKDQRNGQQAMVAAAVESSEESEEE